MRWIDLKENEAIIEYLDSQEMEGVKLATYNQDPSTFEKNKITHIEIHPSAILSAMANQIIFPSNNQFPRDLFHVDRVSKLCPFSIQTHKIVWTKHLIF